MVQENQSVSSHVALCLNQSRDSVSLATCVTSRALKNPGPGRELRQHPGEQRPEGCLHPAPPRPMELALLSNLTTAPGAGTTPAGAELSTNRSSGEQEAGGSPLLHGVAVACQALLLLAIFLLSCLGNCAVIVVISKHRQLRTVTNAFILSLSLADFLSALLCQPFSFVLLFSRGGAWPFGDRFCFANGFFNSCFGIVSTLTMTLISLDRYYAIVRQPQREIGRTRAVQLLAAAWLTALGFSFPWYLLAKEQWVVHKKGYYHCMYVFHSAGSRLGAAYSISLIVLCYLLPFGLMCFCHYNICKAVRLSEIRVRPVTTYAHLLRFYSEMRTATTVLIMIVFIICCRGPYCVMGLVAAAGDYPFMPLMDTVAIWMAWANGAINPLIYAIRNPNISMLLGRNREEGYRTRNIAAYLCTQGQNREVRGRADPIHDRYSNRHGQGSRVSSSSPANGGDLAMWACKNPTVLFCRDGQADTMSEPTGIKSETADTSL
ncbi:G-protein coupled receptor 135 [Bufo bufo]|uniref:G-protein coupled receptor 135 n=1 Tax=Bufo bufo TaxID=8384 RepID=UPI001ABE92EF|nr:G-protein coupled receptor 135 [Bufo bufo]